MAWWGWLVVGIGLLAVEMFVIDAEFYLVFLGASATIVGLLGLAGIPLPEWAQWLLFAGLAIVTMFGFRRRVYAAVRGNAGHVRERVTAGDSVVVPTRLEPGQTCRVEYRGTSWSARNIDVQPIAEGSEAIISHIDDLTLHVKVRNAAP
jgi:membrane protein implicated in regulation of membrane protease activity